MADGGLYSGGKNFTVKNFGWLEKWRDLYTVEKILAAWWSICYCGNFKLRLATVALLPHPLKFLRTDWDFCETVTTYDHHPLGSRHRHCGSVLRGYLLVL